MIESISAVTLSVRDMARSVAFYEALGFAKRYGGGDASFTSFTAGAGYLNLQRAPAGVNVSSRWGRIIFYVGDVDATFARALEHGFHPEFAPRDAPWGERYFHMRDPDGHELSFARPLADG